MKEKCKKFEGLFVFTNEDDFNKHLEICEDCRHEKEKLDNISKLLQTAKPLYFKEKAKRSLQLKSACAIFLFVLSGSVFSLLNYDNTLVETIKYGESLCAEDFGFPVDSYGLIMVDE